MNYQILISIIYILEALFRLILCRIGLGWVLFVRVVDYCQSPVLSFYLFLGRSSYTYQYTKQIFTCFSDTFCIISGCSESWRGWSRPCWWDWWRYCHLPWRRLGWCLLTRTGCRRGRGWLRSFIIWIGMWSRGSCWCISGSIYQVLPLFVIESEMWPQFQWAEYLYGWKNVSDVLHKGFLVGLKYNSNSMFMVTQRH